METPTSTTPPTPRLREKKRSKPPPVSVFNRLFFQVAGLANRIAAQRSSMRTKTEALEAQIRDLQAQLERLRKADDGLDNLARTTAGVLQVDHRLQTATADKGAGVLAEFLFVAEKAMERVVSGVDDVGNGGAFFVKRGEDADSVSDLIDLESRKDEDEESDAKIDSQKTASDETAFISFDPPNLESSNPEPATFVEPTLPARPIIKPVNFGASGGKSIKPTSNTRTAPPYQESAHVPELMEALQAELESLQKVEACLRDVAAKANMLLHKDCVERMLAKESGKPSQLLELMHLAERTAESPVQGLKVVAVEDPLDGLVLVQATVILQADRVKKLMTEKSGKLARLSAFMRRAEKTIARVAKGLVEIVVEKTETTSSRQATTDTNLTDWDTAADTATCQATVKHAGAGHKPAEGSTFNIAGISDATSGTTDEGPLITFDDDD
ncbi:hypothetical protein HDK90DRAFT_461030 [Phyllosticta capitalensis]|uniref:Uncharacterized protein n=1 Tax=Phyllosticta capitalensis TaxID=121624 RepID=A0ABR1Z188_9PEZI